jgi:polyisoprenoid-binding protein YceI
MLPARATLAASLLGFALCASAELSSMPSGHYGLDKTHGYITFSYSHFGFSNPHIGFGSFDVDLMLDSDNIENSTVNVVIDATSIDSRVEVFNGHLNGEDFFDTANYPTITFTSTGIEMTGKNSMNVAGNLTIKGITRPVQLEAMVNKVGDHPMRNVPTIGISAQTMVSRSDWELTEYVPDIGDNVMIWLEIELLQENGN